MSLDADSMAENAQIAYKMETVYFNERASLWIEGGFSFGVLMAISAASLWDHWDPTTGALPGGSVKKL